MTKSKNKKKYYNKRYTVYTLMKHIRDEDHISIWNSSGKKALLLMGFYHGYEALKKIIKENRFNYPDNMIPFKRIKQAYDTDLQLKSFFYPILMQLETAIGNYTIDVIVNANKKHLDSIDSLFKYYLNSYNEFHKHHDKKGHKKLSNKQNKKRNTLIRAKLKLRRSFDNAISYNWNDPRVKHYINNYKPIPIWVIFELISLGNLGVFLRGLNKPIRHRLENLLGIKNDNGYKLVFESIFLLKDLRNSVAHNDIIIDCRFQKENPAKHLPNKIANNFHFNNFYRYSRYNKNGTPGYFTFHSIIDYFVLLVFYQHKLGVTKTDIKNEIKQLKIIINKFKENESSKTYKCVLCTDGDALDKLYFLKKFVMKYY